MSDDQGYGDIAAHGNPEVQTPNLDQLHSESIRLTNFHVDPTCAPTRAALMTGKYSHHVGVWHTVRGGNHLRTAETTMADVFKHNGYKTAIFGKWHLGANYPYRPMDRGFDEWLGLGDGGPGTSDDYFWNDRVNDTYWHNGNQEYREGYNTDVFFEAAGDFIKNHSSEIPFFLYLPTYAPHAPCTLPEPNLAEKYNKMGIPPDRSHFYAMIERIDQNIGTLRQILKKYNLAENTILIFMTDNGSTHGETSFNAGMSGKKGSPLEGGHRVPCFINWPDGRLGEPRDIPVLSAHIDLLPTLTGLCSLELPKPLDFDGASLVPLLRKQPDTWPDRTLYVEVQRELEYDKGKRSAVMTQDWRLVELTRLYKIQSDPAQKKDVAANHSQIVQSLKDSFDNYWGLVTSNDRPNPFPIVGTMYDEEVFLSFSELRDGLGYEHNYAAAANPVKGVWHLEVAEKAVYEFEVCRWPKESTGNMQGIPHVNKTVDSWGYNGAKTHLLYGSDFSKMEIAEVSLKVGDFYKKLPISEQDKSIIYDVSLPKGKTSVEAIFYDENNRKITNAYYVYVRKKK